MSGDRQDEDERAWARATADAKRLPPGNKAASPAKAEVSSRKTRAGVAATPPLPPTPPPAAGRDVDGRTSARLRRGEIEIDGRLDLHGMTQDRAHRALKAFVRSSYAKGRRGLLIITGRPARDAAAWPEAPRGILHARLGDWLAAPDLAPYVLRLAPAQARHGGEGAWYLLLRRRRD